MVVHGDQRRVKCTANFCKKTPMLANLANLNVQTVAYPTLLQCACSGRECEAAGSYVFSEVGVASWATARTVRDTNGNGVSLILDIQDTFPREN